MLKLAHDDARRDTKSARESDDLPRIRSEGEHLVTPRGWNQYLLGKSTGLVLLRRGGRADPLQEKSIPAVQQKMAGFVEKAEPKLIVGEIAETELQQCLPV
jgi:hypothetical protein